MKPWKAAKWDSLTSDGEFFLVIWHAPECEIKKFEVAHLGYQECIENDDKLSLEEKVE